MTNNQQTQISYTGPFITMVFLFFIVGFLTVVNQQFQSPLQGALLSNVGGIQNTLAVMVTFAWFLSYPLTGGIGARLVNRHGYKNTMVRALMVVAVGCAIFEASVLLQKYSDGASIAFGGSSIPYAYFLFLIGAYVVGAGVTIMQVVINPYLIACNVKGTSDVQRQNIGGASNSIGTTLAPFFVGGIIFGGVAASEISLDSLIVPFLAFIVVILGVAFLITKLQLPNIANTTAEGGEKLERSIWSFRHLMLGVVAIFIYVGVEVCVGANLVMHAKSDAGWIELAATMGSLYWGGMLVGRLIGSALSKVPARMQLIVTSVAAGLLVIGAMLTDCLWLLVAVGLFHSVMWPSTFALAVKGLGKYTSAGSGALMIGVLGGGVLPLLQGMIADITHSWSATWIIVILGEAYLLYYALLGSKVRKQDMIAE
ncbi:MAG: MFS transporter [Rikenella sp.]|nr:MFS transporter [Rikenella sp.]